MQDILCSHPSRSALGKIVTNKPEPVYHTRDGADLRKGAVGGSREAACRVEGCSE